MRTFKVIQSSGNYYFIGEKLIAKASENLITAFDNYTINKTFNKNYNRTYVENIKFFDSDGESQTVSIFGDKLFEFHELIDGEWQLIEKYKP